jgi:hypothetical protein
MPVYGRLLGAFPELIETYEVFNMKPFIGGGYGERHNKRKVRGYWSWRKGGKMDVEGELRARNERGTFWEQHGFVTGKSTVMEGDYAEVDGQIYLFVEGDDFSREAGFSKWLVQLASSVTDKQHTNTKVDEAIRNDY